MGEEKHFAMLRAVLDVAWCDGSFDEREERLLEQLAQSLNIDAAQLAALKGSSGDADDPALKRLVSSYDDRLYLYQQAVKMSYADGIVMPEEVEMLRKLRTSLFSLDEAPAEDA